MKMGRLCLWPSIRTSMGKKVNKTFIYNLILVISEKRKRGKNGHSCHKTHKCLD